LRILYLEKTAFTTRYPMKPLSNLSTNQKNNLALAIILVLFTTLYLSGVAGVPFHPDESTYIFMSDDLRILFTDPQSVYWQPEKEGDLRQHYRKLDPPISRNMIAFSRAITGQPSLSADWDWSLTWHENQQAGALPDASLLTASRLGVAIFFPLTLLFLYLAVFETADRLTAWLTMFFMAGSSLVLLHTRRAMSESFLLFAITLSLYFLVHFQKMPWLTAIPVGLALNAKLSTAPIVAVGGLIILILAIIKRWSIKKFLVHAVLYGFVIIAITFILNPFLWAHPIESARSGWQARLELTDRQVATVAEVSPDQVLDNPAKRVGNLLAHLFYTPPAIADVANYLDETAQAAESYLDNPLHSLGRGLIFGSLALVLTLAGFLISMLDLIKHKSFPLLAFTLSGLALTAGILLLVPLPFQRYIIPAMPFSCFWLAYTIARFANGFNTALKKKNTTLI